jgi:hypothetical protein
MNEEDDFENGNSACTSNIRDQPQANGAVQAPPRRKMRRKRERATPWT